MGQRKQAARHKKNDSNSTFQDKNKDIPEQKGPNLPPGLDDDLPDIDTKNLDDES